MSVLVRNLLATVGGLGFALTILGLVTIPSMTSAPELTYPEPGAAESLPFAPTSDAPALEPGEPDEITDESSSKPDTSLTNPSSEPELQAPPEDLSPAAVLTTTPSPGLTPETLNTISRASLVNILCESSQSYLKSISGSGVIVSESGIVLTNAHIAQQLLLEEFTNLPIECVIRYGSPAKPSWKARLLYISPRWIKTNAKSFLDSSPRGTGEHDFALLQIDEPLYPSIAGAPYPFVVPHTKADPVPPGSSVLMAGYPAEFVGGSAARQALSVTTAMTTIKDVYTFTENIVDLLSLGGSALAQSGSSGGAVVNDQGRLVGLIVTTSEGANTGVRDLRAITIEHIDRSLSEDTGIHLSDFTSSPGTTLFAAQQSVHLSLAEELVTFIRTRTQ